MHKLLTALAVAAAVAVPTAAFAAGGDDDVLSAKLSGGVEVPKGDPDGSGNATVTLHGSQVCWTFTLAKVATPNAAHIHRGRPGVAGPVVVPFGAKYAAKGCIEAPKATITSIKKNPAGYYVNVHNAKYPGGAVRGQLAGGHM